MHRAPLVLLLTAALAAVAPARVLAQKGSASTGAFSASVNILFPPLTAAGVHPLDFGMIIPGTTVTPIQPNTPAGGAFRISGTKNRKSIDITMTLPAALAGPNGATIPLTFNGNYAGLCELSTTGVCQAASYTTWNPVTTPTFHDTPTRYQAGRKVYNLDDYAVYIGGGATPAATQAAGHYSATIGMTIVVN